MITVGLHRVLYRIMESIDQSTTSSKLQPLLDIGSKILGECFGPFCVSLLVYSSLNDKDDRKQCTQRWMIILSCYRISISILELSTNYCKSDETINDFTTMLIHKSVQVYKPPNECIDNAAKVSTWCQHVFLISFWYDIESR